jgi:hypothetical protein
MVLCGLSPLSGIELISSLVKTDLNWQLSMSALVWGLLWSVPSVCRKGATPEDSCFLPLIHDQHFFGFFAASGLMRYIYMSYIYFSLSPCMLSRHVVHLGILKWTRTRESSPSILKLDWQKCS